MTPSVTWSASPKLNIDSFIHPTRKRTTKDLIALALHGFEALHWYDKAKEEIDYVCRKTGWCPERFTGLLAVTSPRISVRRNVRTTLHYLQTGILFPNIIGGVKTSVRHFDASGEIRGPKTLQFFNALRGDTDALVLDVWMAKVLGVEQKTFQNRRSREAATRTVKRVAKALGTTPRDTQAILWTGIIKVFGRIPQLLPIKQEYANMVAQQGFPNKGTIPQFADCQGNYQRPLPLE